MKMRLCTRKDFKNVNAESYYDHHTKDGELSNLYCVDPEDVEKVKISKQESDGTYNGMNIGIGPCTPSAEYQCVTNPQ